MTVTKLMTSMLVLALSAIVSTASASTIEERIAPVGAVCVAGTECAAAGKAAATKSGPRSSSDIFNTYCTACHGTGAMGAPKSGDKGVWKDRLAKGFDKTLANAINGINLMPAKGTCSDCSDEEIGNVIKYMSK
ncbi:cytochrome c5 family protein [Oceaniserpentilla sp. 4NH20-0058]|uniref:c-type cytochrome n=1 Tax=Oceaniserpentilla sp. 4NH20-0058 TaxID=3127660 RepID=UPI0031023981